MDGFWWGGGMSGQQIYDNFRQGAGGGDLATSAAYIQDLIKSYEQRAESITQLTVKMESAWQGDAAGAARRGAGPLAVEHGLAAPEMNMAQDSLIQQVSAFDTANTTVVPVPPTPAQPGFWDNVFSLGDAGRTYEQDVAEVDAANETNLAAMSAYEDVTGRNTTNMPTSYGSIEPDHSAVGVQPQTTPPPPPPPGRRPPEPGGTGQGSTESGTGTTQLPPGSTGNGDNNPGDNGGRTGQPPVQTRPDNFVPTPPGPGNPSNVNPNFDGHNPSNNPHGPGGVFTPFAPGGTGTGGPGGRGTGGFGPTGGGAGTDSGRGGAGARGFGPGAGAMGEEGSRTGARGGMMGAGGAAAAEAAGRGAAGAAGRGGGMGGMGMGGGGRGQGADDGEHQRASYLVEADPDATFGTDEVTAPPVIGE